MFKSIDQIDDKLFLVFFPRAITISRRGISRVFFFSSSISSGLSSERIILSPFTKEFRGEGHSYESLNFSGATNVAISFYFHPKAFPDDSPASDHTEGKSPGPIRLKFVGLSIRHVISSLQFINVRLIYCL